MYSYSRNHVCCDDATKWHAASGMASMPATAEQVTVGTRTRTASREQLNLGLTEHTHTHTGRRRRGTPDASSTAVCAGRVRDRRPGMFKTLFTRQTRRPVAVARTVALTVAQLLVPPWFESRVSGKEETAGGRRV